MSLYDKSSLVMIPSGKKDGTVFSQKPVDGTGDFTFSRGSNLTATRVGSDGLIEKGRENLLLQSNQFDTTWTNANTTELGGQEGYDGTNDAWLLTGTGAFPRIQQNVSSSGINTVSVYAKANTNNYLFINLLVNSTGAYASFDLVNQTETLALATKISSEITDIGNGWCRVSLSFSGTLGQVNFGMSNDGSSAGWSNFTSGSIYIQDAQLEIGLAATDYIESGATTGKAGLLEDEPRFDYSGGATCPSLLLEPSRTNLIRYSEYYGSNLLINSSIDINNTTSPEGVQNATLLIENTSSGNHALREAANTGLAGDDSQYVISFYAKSNGRNIRFIDDAYAGSSTIVDFNITSGGTLNNGFLVIDSDAVSFGDGWYYCYAVIDKASATQTSFRFSLRLLGGASNNNDSYTGDGTSGAWIWGKQIEDTVSYPTSYIPNHSGGSVTRGVDVSSVSSMISNGIINDERFTFMTHLKILGRATNPQVYLTDVSGNRIVSLNTQALNKASFYSPDAANYIGNGTFIGDSVKIAISYDGNKFVQYINGAKDGTLSINITSVINGINLNNNLLNAVDVKQVLVFPTLLTDQEAIDLTTI